MYTSPPAAGYIILSVIGILMLAIIPVVALTMYDRTPVMSPQADTVGDAKINAQNSQP
jgi:hypothetical protein